MKASAILFMVLLLSACGVARPVLESDNTKVEVKTVEKVVRDTAYIQLPVIIKRVATLDTSSVLENKHAKSEASVSGGVLHHSLQTKSVREPVEVQSRKIVRDSIVYRDRVQTATKVVEKPLTGWQQAKLRVGGFCFFLVILIFLYIIVTKFLNLFKL